VFIFVKLQKIASCFENKILNLQASQLNQSIYTYERPNFLKGFGTERVKRYL